MRLTAHNQRKIIRDTTAEVFGPSAVVFPFGSRLHDAARGGDIDLLVQSEHPVYDRERKALQLAAKLQMRLGRGAAAVDGGLPPDSGSARSSWPCAGPASAPS